MYNEIKIIDINFSVVRTKQSVRPRPPWSNENVQKQTGVSVKYLNPLLANGEIYSDYKVFGFQ